MAEKYLTVEMPKSDSKSTDILKAAVCLSKFSNLFFEMDTDGQKTAER